MTYRDIFAIAASSDLELEKGMFVQFFFIRTLMKKSILGDLVVKNTTFILCFALANFFII